MDGRVDFSSSGEEQGLSKEGTPFVRVVSNNLAFVHRGHMLPLTV